MCWKCDSIAPLCRSVSKKEWFWDALSGTEDEHYDAIGAINTIGEKRQLRNKTLLALQPQLTKPEAVRETTVIVERVPRPGYDHRRPTPSPAVHLLVSSVPLTNQ